MKTLQPVRLNHAVAEGRELAPMRAWPECMQLKRIPNHRYKMWYLGEKLMSLVYEADDGILQFARLPYDEQVTILEGMAILTSEDGHQHVYGKGDVFVVPQGWSGTWELKGGYRELATFETKSFRYAMLKLSAG
jgi:uncharacterized cupin superfamily protein